ncbi:MAG: hypothetical protein K8F91_17955 [Candidatus Obscuribacterales bacterium]|nr:hypothetical protein [Candidatus Obscuribacterales bacterium]
MFSITDHVPLKFTCGVCGKPLNAVVPGLPDLLGQVGSCSKCGEKVCQDHFKAGEKVCSNCAKGKSDWCSTPPLP